MNRKILILRGLFAGLLVCTYLMIFMFSSEDSVKSTGTSKGAMHQIIDIFNGDNEVSQDDVNKFEPPLRKIAHFSVYTLSGIWSMCLVSTFFLSENSNKKKSKVKFRDLDLKRILISVLIGFLYACSDEIHQLFVNGRSGEFTDVIIDTMGVLNGSLIALLVIKVFIKGKRTDF